MSPRSVSDEMETAHDRSCVAKDSVPSVASAHSRSLSSTKPGPSIPTSLLPSAPESPPTPAPSPTPHRRSLSWQTAEEEEEEVLLNTRIHFTSLTNAKKRKFLEGVLGLCDPMTLSFVWSMINPRLRKDPFNVFPNELCLRVLSFIDDPKSLARASQVSKRWRELLNDDITWKNLCAKHPYASQRPTDDDREYLDPFNGQSLHAVSSTHSLSGLQRKSTASSPHSRDSFPPLPRSLSGDWLSSSSYSSRKRRVRPMTYRSHFKQKYQVQSAWNRGGRCTQRHMSPDQGVVTSLHLTPKYIVVALDNAKIHVYDTNGDNQKTLQGHVMGVWAMVPWDDILVSGGCDREVRVWNMATGAGIYLLRGHTSTVRCLKMSDKNTAISGSRDTTLRIWDLTTGTCKNVLIGHQASVRCLAIHGDIVVSGSYDTTARIWSISEGRCLRTLSGHFSQIYAVAYDGKRIATGSLDTTVRMWDPQTGQCNGILQGHTSLVGQLQMRGDILVTGGSDGAIRIWSLITNTPIHRVAAHDNSVTSLQFDSSRIVTGGSDGRVKIWSLETAQLLRELSTPAEAVWRVAFEAEKAVIMANRSGRTVMEVWDFSAPPEDSEDEAAIESTASTPGPLPTPVDSRHRERFSDPTMSTNNDNDQSMADAPLS
ncbi:F-box/WD repeat-containing protein [Aspergillus homomorphus CBS 101889]|uniref:Probable E3 ubiquitin ligase complex SCF subunit sconB n=1 Tax=Aspergillus homomorphus (strain CBS 101889) TaxID=1450537 RepID=A0A395ID68_ASPHC|nr:WD40 repeat-like protein [Aspergillus homomorphus CBS 101889]RAL17719.1 WD40 repeat-like protein [Aspergillus homomorphus CBS 101889]